MQLSRTIKVSERSHHVFSYASELYNKPIANIVDKLIDTPLIVIESKSPVKSEKKLKSPILDALLNVLKGQESGRKFYRDLAKIGRIK